MNPTDPQDTSSLAKSLFGGKRIVGAFPLWAELEKEGTSEGAKKGWESRHGGAKAEEDKPAKKAGQAQGKKKVSDAMFEGHKHFRDIKRDGSEDDKKRLHQIANHFGQAADHAKAAGKKALAERLHGVSDLAGWHMGWHVVAPGRKMTDTEHAELSNALDDAGAAYRKHFKKELDDEQLAKSGTSDGAKKGWETRRGGEPEPVPSRSMARRLVVQREEPRHHIEGKKLYDDVMRHIEGYKKYADHEDPKLRSAALGPLSGARNKIEELEALSRASNNKQAEGHFQDARFFLEERTGRGGHSGPSPDDAVTEMVAGLDALRGYEALASERSDA